MPSTLLWCPAGFVVNYGLTLIIWIVMDYLANYLTWGILAHSGSWQTVVSLYNRYLWPRKYRKVPVMIFSGVLCWLSNISKVFRLKWWMMADTINWLSKYCIYFVLCFPPARPGGGRRFPAAEPRSLPPQPGASDPGGWGDEGRQDSVMHAAVGSSTSATGSASNLTGMLFVFEVTVRP